MDGLPDQARAAGTNSKPPLEKRIIYIHLRIGILLLGVFEWNRVLYNAVVSF